MSHSLRQDAVTDQLSALKTRQRRTFELTSPPTSTPSTPTEDSQQAMSQAAPTSSMEECSTPSRTRSILNLTSSTLFGIYQPTDYSTDRDEPGTPWGTGAETPKSTNSFDFSRADVPDTIVKRERGRPKIRRRSVKEEQNSRRMQRRGLTGYILPLVARSVALFGAGILYGLLITHLHDRQGIAPVRVEVDRSRWSYLVVWGVMGVALGQALPWIDVLWTVEDDEIDGSENESRDARRSNSSLAGLEGWIFVIRSIGVFVGVAFAIRRLPWESTLQLSLTLALANPAIWYLIDGSPPGFILSTVVALSGAAIMIGTNPTLIPSPSPRQTTHDYATNFGGHNASLNAFGSGDLVLGMFTQESVGVATWIASVFFVSSVCFGNIGRRLAVQN